MSPLQATGRSRSRIVVSALALVLSLSASLAAPVISEFLAINDSGITDEDGEFSDYIEIHNPDAAPISLTGYYLTDSADELTQWQFPEVNLAPGAHLIVFASEKNRRDPSGILHTNFRLSGGGEFLGLTAPDGTTVVNSYAPEYPPQEPDLSYGLAGSSDRNSVGFFNPPTPGELNPTSFTALAANVTFSDTTRTFTSPLSVALSGAGSGQVIRFTTDRSFPTFTSPIYSTPIALTDSTVQIRAAVFQGAGSGPVTTNTYFYLSDSSSVGTIGTTIRDFTSNLPIVVLDNFVNGRPNSDTEMFWTIFEPKTPPGGGEARASLLNPPDLATRGRMRVRGSSTFNNAKYSLRMESWDEFDDDTNVSPLGLPSESDWVLSGRFTFDQALMRNPFIYKLSNDIGRTAMRTRFVEVFISTDDATISTADYFGVYSIIESIKRDGDRIDIQAIAPSDNTEPEITGGYIFRRDRLGPGERGFTVTATDRFSESLVWTEPDEIDVTSDQSSYLAGFFDDLIDALEAPDGIDPSSGLSFEEVIDLPAWIDHHWLNVVAMNVDGFRLSGYYHKDRLGPVVAGPIWDFDRTMGSTDPRDDNPLQWDGTSDSSKTWFDTRYPWFGRLLGYSSEGQQFPAVASTRPDVFQQHADRWFELREGVFATENMNSIIDGFAAEIGEGAERNFVQWPSVAPARGFGDAVETMKDWLEQRTTWIDGQYPIKPTFTTPGGQVSPGTTVSATTDEVFATTDGSDPRASGGIPAESATTITPITEFTTVVTENSICRYLIPLSAEDAPGITWTVPSFDDSTWTLGILGLGYQSTGSDYASLIRTDVRAAMQNVNPTAYVRVPFTLPSDSAEISQIRLEVIADDGFIAYLNGTAIGESNAPTGTPAFDSTASGSRRNSEILAAPIVIDASDFIDQLQEGQNYLGLHLLNLNASNSDALISPTLKIGIAGEATPLTINTTSVVTARTRGASAWSAPARDYYFVGETPASASDVVVSEIMYHPASPSPAEIASGFTDEDAFEYIELQNIGSSQINLLGTRFTRGVSSLTGPESRPSIAPGEVLLIVADVAAFEARYGPGLPIAGTFADTQLSNSGEGLTIADFQGAPIKSFSYNDTAPWPIAADGAGPSLELISPGTDPDPALATSWRASTSANGSPGTGALIGGETAFNQFVTTNNLGASDGDNDNDGIADLIEFVFGTDPNDASSALDEERLSAGITETEGTTRLTLTVVTSDAATGTTRRPEFSTDLENWTSGGITIIGTPTSSGGFTTTTYRTPALEASGSAFLRLAISAP